MKEIIKKELAWYFNSPIGYILMVLFICFANYLFMKDIFITNNASLRPYFQMLPWILLFVTSGISMRAMAEERRLGTLEVLMTLPLREHDIIVGKFIADVIFVAISLLFSASVTFLVTF